MLRTVSKISLLILAVTACNDDKKSDSAAVVGSGVRGGSLYDHIWTETGQQIPDQVYVDDFQQQHRCKGCHGWDYKGSFGVYGTNFAPKPFAIPFDLAVSRAKETDVLIDRLLDTSIHPNYLNYLEKQDFYDLVTFIKANMVDTGFFFFYDEGLQNYIIAPNGDTVAGDAFIQANCIACHGAVGDQIETDAGEFSLGTSMRYKWYETHHKVLYGSPGTEMKPIPTSPADLLNMLAAFCQLDVYPSVYIGKDETESAEIAAKEEIACTNYR